MDIELKKTEIACLRPCFSQKKTQEGKTECIVPDALPDAEKVLFCSGCFFLHGCDNRGDAVTADGLLRVTVLLSGETGTVFPLVTELPLEITAALPAAVDGETVLASVRLSGAEAKLQNSRKVQIKYAVEAEFFAAEKAVLALADGAAETAGLHLQTKKASCFLLSETVEKTFELTDELHFSPDFPVPKTILSSESTLLCEETKFTAGRMIVRGKAVTALIYLAAESGELCAARFETPFSQLVETTVGESAEPVLSFCLTGAWTELQQAADEEPFAELELHVLLRGKLYQPHQTSYLADAFSTRFELNMQRETLEEPALLARLSLRETFRETLKTRSEAAKVLAVSASLRSVTAGEASLRVLVELRLIAADAEGRCFGAVASLPFSCALTLPEGAYAEVAEASLGAVRAVPKEAGLEISLPFSAVVFQLKRETIESISSISEDEEKKISLLGMPSAVIVRASGRSFWELSKKFNSTPEAICEANARSEAEILPESLLLIPKVSK